VGATGALKLLLDTHIWIWAVDGSPKLGRAARRSIESPSNELFLSPISVWEAHHLESKGRIRYKGGFDAWLEAAHRLVPVLEAAFNFEVAREASRIKLTEPDIGDVFLAATASVFELRLVTADSQLLECSWLKTLANR
jgi:PIN domain nuclease of toxin-antitoxin system